jgi:hypothetical protein
MICELLSPYRNWCEEQSNTAELRQITERELSRMNDSDYLQSDVIGTGEFEWDFRCLDEGFQALVGPFLKQHSGVSPLFLSVLRELGADTEQSRDACLFIEYGHFATLINDYYMFHPDLTAKGIGPRRVSLLTQLRYAGQYLSMYPRYLLVSNRFDLSDRQQIDLHEALAGSVVVQGASRGVILKGSVSEEGPQSHDRYLQYCINTIHSYIVFPVVLAAILAGLDRSQTGTLRVALGHLALAVKLAIERNSISQDGPLSKRSDPRSTADILLSPGFHALNSRRGSVEEIYDPVITENYDAFLQTLSPIAVLEPWARTLTSALRSGSED